MEKPFTAFYKSSQVAMEKASQSSLSIETMEEVINFPLKTKQSIFLKSSNTSSIKTRNYKKLSANVLTKLREAFKNNHYPTKVLLEELSEELKETRVRIKNWFRTERRRLFKNGSMAYEVISFFFFPH